MKLKDFENILSGHWALEYQHKDGSTGYLDWSESRQVYGCDDISFTYDQLLELEVLEIHPESCTQLRIVLSK